MTTQLLSGHHVAFTGKTTIISRASVRQIVEQAGGIVVGTVTPMTTMLVVGCQDQVSMHKIALANDYGTRVMTEAEFIELLNLGQMHHAAPRRNLE